MKYLYFLALLKVMCIFPAFSVGNNHITGELSANQSLGFIENKGQFTGLNGQPVPNILYQASSSDVHIYITTEGLTYQFIQFEETYPDRGFHGAAFSSETIVAPSKWSRMDMNLKGASIKRENIVTANSLPGFNQYFYPHCPDGISDVKTYTEVTIQDIYPFIDWKIYTNPTMKGLKYDFILHPGANPNDIILLYEGAGEIAIRENKIDIITALGKVEEGTLKTFLAETKQETPSSFKIRRSQITKKAFSFDNEQSKNTYEVSIDIPNYDPQKTYIVDPELSWATYYGGSASSELFTSMESDGTHIFVGGHVGSSGFPTDSASGAFYQGTYQGGVFDLIISKFSAGGVLKWATYYGGSGSVSTYHRIAVYNSNLWVAGGTNSSDFPLQDMGGTAYFRDSVESSDAFILRFDTSGTRIGATLIGGGGNDAITGLDVDESGIWTTGTTASSDFPLVSLSGAHNDNTLSLTDGFITKFNFQGEIEWSTFLGGSSTEYPYSLFVKQGIVWTTGTSSSSSGFPITDPGNGAYSQSTTGGSSDGYIVKLDTSGVIKWATLFGGNLHDEPRDIYSQGKWVWIAGRTKSFQTSFPKKKHVNHINGESFYDATRQSADDAFIAQFDTAGVQLWTTYFGGDNDDIIYSIDGHGHNVYFSGETISGSSSFPRKDPEDGSYYNGVLNKGDSDGSGNSTAHDIFLASFDTNAVRNWVTVIGGEDDEWGGYMDIDNQWIWIAGGGRSQIDFPGRDPGDGAHYQSAAAGSGSSDGLIYRLGPLDPIIPTPVEWLALDAHIIDEKQVLVEWSTATEINNDYFTVLRSPDGISFNPIGYVNGMGNSSHIQSYSFMDYEPLSSFSYYQIQQTDFDGTQDKSNIVPIYIGNTSSEVVIYPNPTTSKQLFVHFSKKPSEVITIKLVNSLGAICYTKQVDVSTFENNELILHLPPTLSSGLYYLTLFSEHFLHSESVVYETK